MDTPSTKQKYKTGVTSKHWKHILLGERHVEIQREKLVGICKFSL
jgi:hypothetical protein